MNMPSKGLDNKLNILYQSCERIKNFLRTAHEHGDVRDAIEAMIEDVLNRLDTIPENTEE